MNNKIYIDIDKLNNIIDKLKKDESKLINLFESQKKLNERIKECWTGTNGSRINENLINSSKNYGTYLSRLRKQIEFLEKTRDDYLKMDNEIENKMEDNRDNHYNM